MTWYIVGIWGIILVLLAYPLYRVPVILFFRDTMEEIKEIRGNRKWWKWFVQKLAKYLHKGLIEWLERLIKLSGNKKYKASELVVFDLILVIIALFASQVVEQGKGVLFIALVGMITNPIMRMKREMKERQLEASVTIQHIKRRVSTDLKLGIPLDDSLRNVSVFAPTAFGSVFRDYIEQIGSKPRPVVMRELRELYEVRDLDSFCIAIEQSADTSRAALITLLDRQIEDENKRLDELIAMEAEVLKPKMYGVAAGVFAVTMTFSFYFLYLYITHQYNRTGGSIFNLFFS